MYIHKHINTHTYRTYVYLEILATFLIWRLAVRIKIAKFLSPIVRSWTCLIYSLLAVQLPKLISANILLQTDLTQIAKFNDDQYFQIYSTYVHAYEHMYGDKQGELHIHMYVCTCVRTLATQYISAYIHMHTHTYVRTYTRTYCMSVKLSTQLHQNCR